VLRSNPVPNRIVSDQLRRYSAAKADISELVDVKHVFVKVATRVNNRAENSHQPTRRRERQMCGFRDARPHANVSLMLWPDPPAFRVAQTSDERGMSPCHIQGTFRHVACLDCHCRRQ
jgi:hypothetical protein